MLTKRWLSKITPNLWREYCVNTTLKEGQMYILIVETQFHRCLRQIEVVEYKCENGYGYGYPDGYPDILYPILLHHCNLGVLYHYQGRLEEAEEMYQRALEVKEKGVGPEHILTLS